MTKKTTFILLSVVVVLTAIVVITYRSMPIIRIGLHSDLIMLGDFNGDNKWDADDKHYLGEFLKEPFAFSALNAVKADVNRNGLIDEEDILILDQLFRYSDPYEAQSRYSFTGRPFPRPRELFKYLPKSEYLKRPLFNVPHKIVKSSDLKFLDQLKPKDLSGLYKDQLLLEIYDEAVRFSLVYEKRKGRLNDVEKKYALQKIDRCNRLYARGEYYELLLALISLVEDAETLTTEKQSEFIRKVLFLRDDLKALLSTELYLRYVRGKASYKDVLGKMEEMLRKNLSIDLKIEELPPPRDLLKLENYVERAEWQRYKSSANKRDFERLLLYAQYDPRYLRAVSRTSKKNQDLGVENHNLPMILLFREALDIKKGDKKAAVGLLDEAIRIPFTWIKSIPREKLPSSIALENFLLPGNKEDGCDKSRHWNVFGGISLYKSPEESLGLALAREMKDLREGKFTPELMTEFIRDTIANINGIYYVVSIDPQSSLSGVIDTKTAK